MRKRSHIDDFDYLDTCTVDRTDSGLTSRTRTFNINFYFAQACVISNLGAIRSCGLSSIRSVLFRTAEAHLTG